MLSDGQDQDPAPVATRLPGRSAPLPAWTMPQTAPPATADHPAPPPAPEGSPPGSGSSAGDQPRRTVGRPDTAMRLVSSLALAVSAAVAKRTDPDDAELLMTEDEQAGASKAGRIVHRHVQLPMGATWDDAADLGEALLAVGSWAGRLASARLRRWRDTVLARRAGDGQDG